MATCPPSRAAAARLVAALAAGEDLELATAQRLARRREAVHAHDEVGIQAADDEDAGRHRFIRFQVRRRRHSVGGGRTDNHGACRQTARGFLHAHLSQAGAEDGHHQRAERRRRDGAASARQAGAADDDGGDGFKLQTDAGVGVGSRQASRLRDGRQPGQRAAQREGDRANAARVDAGQVRGFVVGADGDDLAPEHRVRKRPLSDDDDREGQQHGRAQTRPPRRS